MFNILLIWLLAFIGNNDQSFICHQYRLTVNDSTLYQTEQVCYISTFEKSQRKYYLTIHTDSLTVKFSILNTFPIKDGQRSFAIVTGHPDQLYTLVEIYREEYNQYYFAAYPIRMSGRIHRNIDGVALEISNQKICH